MRRVLSEAFRAPAEQLRGRREARHRAEQVVKDIHRLAVPVLVVQAVGEVHLEMGFRGVQQDRLAKPRLCDDVRADFHKVHSDVILGEAREQHRLR